MREIVWRLDDDLDRRFSCVHLDDDFGTPEINLMAASISAPKLDFGQISRRSAVARDAEHRIVLDDLLGALEHELHAPEVAERRPATLGV